jgi:phosphoribosylformylglycinamidine synthase
LGLPVTGGNVSLYNESPSGAILPTPEIGVVGLLDDASTLVGPAFQNETDAILLVGDAGPGLAGSAYASVAGLAPEDGPPALDLDRERALQAFCREAARRRLVASAQDVSGGGLAVALAESSMWSDLGARVRLAVVGSPAVDLFGESPSRVVLSARAATVGALVALAAEHGLPIEEIGTVGGERLIVDLAGAGATGAAEERGSRVADSIDVPLDVLRHAWDQGLPRALGWTTEA